MTREQADILKAARAFEVNAMRVGEETREGRASLSRAARLRVDALGPRSYPVLICPTCFSLTGWLSVSGSCDPCLRRAQTLAAYSDPHGDFVTLNDVRPPARERPRGRKRSLSVGGIFARRALRDRELVKIWLTYVDPDATGPISPEEGYEIEIACRDEIEAADRSTMLIRFRTRSCRFTGGAWAELATTRIPRYRLCFPAEQSAGLPTEQIVEAWLDYKAATHEFNTAAWLAESAGREDHRQAEADRQETLRAQRDTIDLLDESP